MTNSLSNKKTNDEIEINLNQPLMRANSSRL